MELGALLPLLLLAVVFWFLIMRPARKRQADQRATVAALAPGRRVMTASGLFGTVTAVSSEQVELEIADGVRVEFLPAAIMQVLPEPGADAAADVDARDEAAGTTARSGSSDAPEDDTPTH